MVSGLYPYGGWDGVHYPLFAVGSTGPPSFVYLDLHDGHAAWSCSPRWEGSGWTLSAPSAVYVVALVGGLALVALLSRPRRRAPHGRRPPHSHRGESSPSFKAPAPTLTSAGSRNEGARTERFAVQG